MRCSNYTWVKNNFIAYKGATYSRGLMVAIVQTSTGSLSIRPMGVNFSEEWLRIHEFSHKKINFICCLQNDGHICLIPNVLSQFAGLPTPRQFPLQQSSLIRSCLQITWHILKLPIRLSKQVYFAVSIASLKIFKYNVGVMTLDFQLTPTNINLLLIRTTTR